MSSIQFVVHPLPGTELEFNERLREVSDKINKYGSQTAPALQSLKAPVKQIVIGANHLGILLEDGHAFRVAFSVIPERLDLSKQEPTKNSGSGGGGGGGGVSVNNASGNSKNSPSTSSRQLARSRGRIMRTNSTVRIGSSSQSSSSRSTGVIIGGGSSGRSLVAVPAPFVPEDLVTQAQVVLQGKSRNMIIRELQRTNLDVNLAVNNLLSRDDEEGEDTEEGGDNYVPEDLISLLDGGFHDNSVIIDADAMFSEDMFGYSSMRRGSRSDRNQSTAANSETPSRTVSGTTASGTSTVSGNGSGVAAGAAGSSSAAGAGERDAFSRWRDRQYFNPRRWFQNSREDTAWERDTDSKKKEISTGLPLWISDELEPWPEKDFQIRFSQIAALHSEFIGVSVKGELHQWKWCEPEPYRNAENMNVFHPKTLSLNLAYEKIIHISATSIRCTVATENNRIATWMDDLLGHAGSKLEHASMSFLDFSMDKIISLHTCTLYTVARTESGGLFWWGVLPYGQRKRLWDKYRAKARKPVRPSNNAPDVTVGAQVCMKNSPMYQPGAIGFCISNGVPKVGQLMNAAWDLGDVCRFKLVVIPPQNVAGASAALLTSELKDLSKACPSVSTVVPPVQPSSSKSSGGNSNNKENADRLDMPPPPSPASSTCSDTGSVTSHKRQKRMTPKEEGETKKDEESWQLKDVVFVEDVRSIPIGKVLKVDGAYAAVKFPNINSSTKDVTKEESDAWQDCRLMRKDELQVIKSTTTSRVPDCFQKTPRRIILSPPQSSDASATQLLTLTIDSKGIHSILKVGNKLHYSLFNLNTGRQEQNSIFPTDINAFLGNSVSNISLTCAGENSDTVLILRDGNGTIYPMTKDCVEAIKDPNWLDLPPIKCIAAAPLTLPSVGANMKSQVAIVAIVPEPQILMSRILRCDIEGIKNILSQLDGDLKFQLTNLLGEKCDGNRNIFHTCVSMCSPASNKDTDAEIPAAGGGATSNTSTGTQSNSASGLDCINVITNAFTGNRPVSIREMMRRAQTIRDIDSPSSAASNVPSSNPEETPALPIVYWPPEYDPASGDEDSLGGINSQNQLKQNMSANYISDTSERRNNAIMALSLMCECPTLLPFMRQLLSAKDAQGQTPFMLAVACRAYPAGIVIFNTIMKISNGDTAIRDAMIFPTGSLPDQSPLHILCCNDTCSFTWTGADHINQDIFECRTCGLTGSLCCCTECAKVCHKGHECRLKRTSPTAYCDCWEKCKCKALIAGNQSKRFELLCKLASETDLVTRFNSRGESILLFLIQTVGRQLVEQRQYRATSRNRGSSGNSRKTPSLDADADMPEHDLEPPKFAKRALDRLLVDWPAVKSMIMTGAEQENANGTPNQVFYEDSDNQSLYLKSQSGTTLLDKFTHSLFVRCNHEPLDTLLMTLIKELQNDKITGRIDEAQKVARRFVRSVARVFVIFSIEKVPNLEKQRRYSSSSHSRYIQTCKRVFQSLIKIAIEELCETADALIAPVRLGVVRPTAPFSLSSNIDVIANSEDLFSVEPLAPATARQNDILDVGASTSRGVDAEQSTGFISRINLRMRDIEDNNDADDLILAIGQDDGEISEQDELSERDNRPSNRPGNNTNNLEEEAQDPLRNEEVAQEAESDTEFNFHEAETESDSDDNQSTQDAQRSVQTGATAGSDTGIGLLMLPEDDSGDSSQPDDDQSEDGETDDHSQEDFTLGEEQLERRTNPSSGHQRSNLAPQSMQWAIRSREANRSSGVRLASSSGLVFIDPSALRRTSAASAAVAAASQEPHTMATTASCLARAFGIVIRQISDLLGIIPDYMTLMSSMQYVLNITYQEAVQLQMHLETRLKSTWDWMLTVMDATEAQLRFGASLTNSADPSHPLHPLHSPHHQSSTTTTSNSINIGVLNPDGQNARREFLTYCLSLMRAHNSEHRDSLPVLDVTALKHIAYVLDAVIYYMRAGTETDAERADPAIWNDPDENENEDNEDEFSNPIGMETDSIDDSDILGSSLGRRHSFFQRSESTLCLGCPLPDPFNTPLTEALPLADQPHLLQPNARREDLFGMPKQPITLASNGSNSQLETPPTRLGLSPNTKNQSENPVIITTHHETSVSEIVNQQPFIEVNNEIIGSDDIMGGGESSSNNENAVDISEKMKVRDVVIMPQSPEGEPPELIKPQRQVEEVRISGGSSNSLQKNENFENIYIHLKKRNYHEYHPSTLEQKLQTADDDDHHLEQNEEPQDLSCSKENTQQSEKMEVDSEEEMYDNDSNELKSSRSSKIDSNIDETAQDHSSSSIRPQIIVTPRKVAAAIESVTQSVLAKNKKTCLSECVQPETPINLLPTSFALFAFQTNAGASTSAAAISQSEETAMHHSGTCSSAVSISTAINSPSKSVIVRAGPSSCSSSEVLQHADTMETQEISAHVTVETTPNVQATVHQEFPMRGLYFRQGAGNNQTVTSDLLLGRWRLSLDLFGRVFMEDVGMEPGSIVSELGGFPVKEVRFRRHMERLRNNQQKDLTFSKMERNRTNLLVQTFKDLNTQFGSQNRRINPPLGFNRVKVTFKDEPGEGSGVARSFYTSIAEALLANEKIPNLEAAQVGSSKYSVSFTSMLRHRSSSGRESSTSSSRKNVSSNKSMWRPNRENRKTLNYDARSYRPVSQDGSAGPSSSGVAASGDGVAAGSSTSSTSGYASSGNSGKKMNPIVLLEEYQVEDNAPLFYAPGKRGFYTPRQGLASFERINAFRNVGRLIGLCLLQNELFPLFLQRHVLKFILGRTVRFHDLAFFDPVVYESLRQLVKDSQSKNASAIIASLELNFVIDLCPEEGGITVELVPGGRDIPVNETNVYDYVRKYAEFRMIKVQEKALEAMRHGVFDVLPDGALDTLTAEDLRLLLNGVGDIHVGTLISYTVFNDESGATSEKLLKFKRWLWSIVEKMSNLERQDLVYFWTGSPALPASEDGFQPMPSVTIRPEDAHLPTANTCISRLYIPLYSSKVVLKHKLLLAIKTKNFGFV